MPENLGAIDYRVSNAHVFHMRAALLVAATLALTEISSAAPRHIFNESSGVWPIGFSYFCMDNPAECEPLPVHEPTTPINYRLWESRLDDANKTINGQIIYKRDTGEDTWSLAPSEGDCEDYALTKYAHLLKMGLPRGVMHFAYVLIAGGESHVVLLIETDEGPKVLDNNADEAYDLNQMMISRLSIQDVRNPRFWTQIF